MKSLIISVVSIAVLITSWIIFVNYADKNIHQLMNTIEDDIIVNVYEEDWNSASDKFKDLSEKWHKQKKVYSFFFDATAINNTDFSISKAKDYIKSQNISLAAGELNCIKEQLGFLHLNELITLDNVF